MNIKFILFAIALCVITPSVMANSSKNPVLVIAETNCDKTYLIQIYESGKISYRGGTGVNVFGKNETKISKQTLNELLNKFNQTGLMTSYSEQEQLIAGVAHLSIQLYQNNQTFNFSKSSDKLEKFRDDVIETINLKKWIGDERGCGTGKKRKCNTGGGRCVYSLRYLKTNK